MKPKAILLGVLALALAGGAGLAEKPVTGDVEALTPQQDLAVESFLQSLEPAVDTALCTSTDIQLIDFGRETMQLSWHCPFGAPRCFQDEHCDSYCGGEGFGVCDQQTRCCLCAG